MKNVRIKVVGAVLAVCGLIILVACLTNNETKPELPLTADQRAIAERLENTVHGDLVYDTETGRVWRVINRPSKSTIVLARSDYITSPDIDVESVARWADVVTNGLGRDPRYCQLAEQHLTKIDQ